LKLPDFNRLPDAIAIDLDGTLLNSDTQLSERSCMAVEACIENGIPVVIVTQRAIRTVRRILGNELCDKCSLVLLNGAFAYGTPPLSGYIRETIKSSLVEDITQNILKTDTEVRILTETGGNLFGSNIKLDPDELWTINAATPEMQLPLDIALSEGIVKILVDGLGRDLSSIIAEISRQFGNMVSVTPAGNNTFLNVTNNNASKPKTLKRLLDSKQIPMNNTVAFGDDPPDIEMLQECGISVAMDNAFPEVKAVCTYHTDSNDKDGVAQVLERLFNY